jgi:hypothetical protein
MKNAAIAVPQLPHPRSFPASAKSYANKAGVYAGRRSADALGNVTMAVANLHKSAKHKDELKSNLHGHFILVEFTSTNNEIDRTCCAELCPSAIHLVSSNNTLRKLQNTTENCRQLPYPPFATVEAYMEAKIDADITTGKRKVDQQLHIFEPFGESSRIIGVF